MLEWLFNFSPLHFAEGEVGWQIGPGVYLVGLLVLVLGGVFVAVYVTTKRYARDRDKAVSFGLRGAVLALLCLPLLEPVLVVPDVVPDENFVAVVLDASASMGLPDGADGATRRDEALRLLLDDDDGLVPTLANHFKVRAYTFSGSAERSDTLSTIPADGPATDLSAALARILDDFAGMPLAGVVLLTDGADNSDAVPLNQAEALRARGVPLHIVGLGREAFEAERELLAVAASRGVEETTGAEVDVTARSWADGGEAVEVRLLQGGEVVLTETHTLKGDGKMDRFTLFYEPPEPGAAEYTVQLAEAPVELNTANNSLPALIDTRRDTLRVLYMEGHLRRDFKFIKRALDDDAAVHFTSIARTGTGKYYRQGIRTPDELAGGFPTTAEALYGFDAVIFGDIEASAFSLEQLALLEDFVRVRGGGFLMLGGRNTFAEGTYWNGPVANLLPVGLDPARRQVLPEAFGSPEVPSGEQGFRFAPTADGYQSPLLKLSSDPQANSGRWASMPGLTSINYLGPVKPGAVVLAEKPEDAFGPSEPLLVVQRYGKGRTAALATASTWRWQMLLPADDPRHERFWRQIARWLTASATGRVHLDAGRARHAPGDEVPLRVDVVTDAYLPLDGARVEAFVTDPFGTVRAVGLQPELAEPGTYTGTYIPSDEGVYQIDVTAIADEGTIGQHTQRFLVRPTNREFLDATLKRRDLEHLAEAAGGAYYTPDEASTLPVNLRSRRTSTSIYHARYLWDMPAFYALLLLLLCTEWVYRRRRGLA